MDCKYLCETNNLVKKIVEGKDEEIKIDGKTYTFSELDSMKVIKCRNLDLSGRGLKELPSWVAKCEVGGSFWCDYNNLTSLSGAPNSVGRDFWCYNNKLTSLSGAPKSVGGGF